MSGFSELQHKAIAWYSEAYDCTPQLSPWPTVYFKRKSDGGEVKFNIFDLTVMFETERKEARKEAARLKRQQERDKR